MAAHKCPKCREDAARKPGTKVAQGLYRCPACTYVFCIVEEQTGNGLVEDALRQENAEQAKKIEELEAALGGA